MHVGQTRYVNRLFRQRQREGRKSARTQSHWLDVWLPRISHFSQFGLFAVTVGGLYFTVLPLYQKAVLEEAIARREVQLAASEKALEDIYARLRSYAIGEFVARTGAKCSGLLLPPASLRALDEKKAPAPSLAEEIFGIKTEACLKEAFQNSKSLNQLRSSDLQTLAVHVDRINANIAAKRESALVEYRSIPQRAKADPSILKPLGPSTERMLTFLSKSQPAAWVEANRFSQAVIETQLAVAGEYGAYIRDQLFTLRSLTWEVSP